VKENINEKNEKLQSEEKEEFLENASIMAQQADIARTKFRKYLKDTNNLEAEKIIYQEVYEKKGKFNWEGFAGVCGVVLAIFGFWYNKAQNDAEKIELNMQRISEIIKKNELQDQSIEFIKKEIDPIIENDNSTRSYIQKIEKDMVQHSVNIDAMKQHTLTSEKKLEDLQNRVIIIESKKSR
jgi:hypothetical protein